MCWKMKVLNVGVQGSELLQFGGLLEKMQMIRRWEFMRQAPKCLPLAAPSAPMHTGGTSLPMAAFPQCVVCWQSPREHPR